MNDFVELRHYITIILRRWWILLLGAVLGAVLGYQVSQRLERVYQSTSTLVVGQSIQSTRLDNRDIQTSEQLALTYAEIGRRQPVLEATVETLDLDIPWQQLRKQVHFTPLEGTQLFEVTAEAGSPEEAEAIAGEIARQLILLSPATAVQAESNEESTLFVQERLDSLEERIHAGQARIETLESRMTAPMPAADLRELQAEINSLEQLITDWENNYARLLDLVETKTPVNYLTILEEPYANRTPVRPRVKLNTLIAGIAGLFLALFPAFLLEHLDNSIKSTDDLNQLLDLPMLGTVGKMKGKEYEDKLLTTLDPFSPPSEAYRMIRGNIRFLSEERPFSTILVTSGNVGEGKSLTVANLGLAMAQAGNKTIIVDADLRRPVQHKIFGVSKTEGLTELLGSQELEFNGYIRETGIEALRLVPSGSLITNPSELLSSGYTELLLTSLTEQADIVILDGPPVLNVSDAAVLSSLVDGAVVVIESGRTERQAARRTIGMLRQAGANVLGVVLNRAARVPGSGYYKSYRSDADGIYGHIDQPSWWHLPFRGATSPAQTTEVTGNGKERTTELT